MLNGVHMLVFFNTESLNTRATHFNDSTETLYSIIIIKELLII